MTQVLVVLSGCGVFDGAEIHESVLTLLHLDRHNAEITIAAPDIQQAHVVNHQTSEEMAGETRSVRVEAARIARGPVMDLADVSGDAFDAVIFPGGFGAAKNLCNFATKGAACEVNPDVKRVLTEAHNAGKPIGLICISPAIGAKVFTGATVTIGTDESTANAIEQMGAKHEPKKTEEICVDEANRLVTTPAYMTAQRITEADAGIGKLVERVLTMAAERTPAGAVG